jgi:Domain of unknown function (DUF4836)
MKNVLQTLSSGLHPFAARLVPTIFLAFALSASQAQSPDLTAGFRHIPADADQVISINLSTLLAKADFKALLDLAQKQNLGKGMNMSFLKDIFNSGIDFRQEIIIAIKPSAGPDSPSYTTGILRLTDSAKFVAFTRANDKDMHILHLPGKDRVAASGKQAWAWNDKFLVLVMYKTPKGKPVDPNAILQYHAVAARKAVAALHGFDHSAYLTNQDFKTGFSDDADIHVWNRYGAGLGMLSKLMQMTPAAATPQAQGFSQIMKSMSKVQTLTTIRFDAGKIVVHSSRFITGEDSSIATRLTSQPIDENFLASIPPGKLLGMYAVHYSFAPMLESLAKFGMKQKVDSGLQKMGLTTQDITHALKGDIMVLCYAPDTGKNPQFFLAATIDDRSSFDKITTILKLGAPTDTAKKFDPHFAIQNNIVVFAKSQALADSYFKHPSAGNTPNRLLADRSKANTNFLAVDIHVGADYLSQVLTKGDTLAAKDQKVLDIVRQFDSFILMGGRMQGGSQLAVFELRFTDPNKNSLASILGIVAKEAAMK